MDVLIQVLDRFVAIISAYVHRDDFVCETLPDNIVR